MKIDWKRPWVYLWIFWIGLFFAIEIPAILNDDSGDTLSEHVWATIKLGSFFWFAVAALLVWLIYHFLWEGRNRR